MLCGLSLLPDTCAIYSQNGARYLLDTLRVSSKRIQGEFALEETDVIYSLYWLWLATNEANIKALT